MLFENPFKPKRGRPKKNPFETNLNLGLSSSSTIQRDKRRAFTITQKNEIWAQQNGKCAKCKNKLDLRFVEYHHQRAWSENGKTIVKNGRALCANCHKLQTHKSRLKKTEKKEPSRQKSIFDLGFY